MKKLLGIVVLGLLLISNHSFADCYSDLKTRWDQNKNNSAYNTYDKGWQRNLTGTFTFNNPTKNTIQITQVSIKAKDGNTVYSANHNLIIDPYTKDHRIGVKLKNNFTEEVIEGYYYACRYAKAGTSSKNQYKTKNKKSDSWFKWWYLLFILPAIGLLKGFFEDISSKSNNKKNKSSVKKIKSEKEHPGNFIEDIWDGKKPLGETYWLYFVLINGIISFGSAFFAELNGNNFYFVPGLISNVVTMVGVWNSSTFYQLKKIEDKQPYGWVYAAKVSVVLNGISIAATAIQVFTS